MEVTEAVPETEVAVERCRRVAGQGAQKGLEQLLVEVSLELLEPVAIGELIPGVGSVKKAGVPFEAARSDAAELSPRIATLGEPVSL
jgi:hypothetical protein